MPLGLGYGLQRSTYIRSNARGNRELLSWKKLQSQQVCLYRLVSKVESE